MLAIDSRDLTKLYDGKTAINRINLKVETGTVLGVVGAMGSGKTTLIRLICGLIKPTSGKIYCLGQELGDSKNKILEEVGYLTQHFSLYNELTVVENLELIARLYQIKNVRSVVEQTIDRFSLNEYANKNAAKLSGGWKKRLSFAAAIIHQPKIVILDEPTAGVDPNSRSEFWDMIYKFSSEGMTVVVSTHYMDEAERCSSIYYLDHGTVKFFGKPRELISKVNLITFHVDEKNNESLITLLRKYPFIVQVIRFGNQLHVSTNQNNIENIKLIFKELGITHYQQRETSLEDAFIAFNAKFQ